MSKCVQLNKQTKLKTEEEKTKNPSFGFRGKSSEIRLKFGNLEKMSKWTGLFFSKWLQFLWNFQRKKLSFGFSGKKKGKKSVKYV